MNHDDPWKRLGQLLIARRVELGFKTRAAFARHHNLSHDRGISAIENAERQNFSPATIASLEMQYGWEPDSIYTVLAGGDPTPRGTTTTRPSLSDYSDSEVLLDLARRLTEGQLAATRLEQLENLDQIANLPPVTADEQRQKDDKMITSLLDLVAFSERVQLEDQLGVLEATLRTDADQYIAKYGREAYEALVAGHDAEAAVDASLSNVTSLPSRDSVEGHEPPVDAAAFETGQESAYERQAREQDEDAERPDV